MHRTITTYLFSVIFLLASALSGCTHTVKPTDSINAVPDESVITSGLGEEISFGGRNYHQSNLINTKNGPHQGLLGKRSYYFAFDSSIVNQTDYPAIKAHANYLMTHRQAKIIVEGNADIRGSREYNIALGQRRADAVANILQMQGVSKSQIETVSFGAEKPVAFGNTEAAYQLNRRVDIVYKKD